METLSTCPEKAAYPSWMDAMIHYEDEDPQIRKDFEDRRKREGVACRMAAVNYC